MPNGDGLLTWKLQLLYTGGPIVCAGGVDGCLWVSMGSRFYSVMLLTPV